MWRWNEQALKVCLKAGVACGVLLAGLGIGGAAKADPKPLWVEQVGSTGYDEANGVATDSQDNVVVAGTTSGKLAGGVNGYDAWVAKYDALGKRLWIKQFGTRSNDYGTSVAADTSGNVFVAGYTGGDLGGKNKGGNDAFVAKYSPTGKRLWAKLIGTKVFTEPANGVATDSDGSVIICGYSNGQIGQTKFGSDTDEDAWLAKYDKDGKKLWVRQLGSSERDECNGVATDKFDNVVLTGVTYGDLGGPNPKSTDRVPWIAKYDTDGNLVWVHQVVSKGVAWGNGIATDKKANILVGGTTVGRIVPGPYQGFDAWVAKYNPAGKKAWIQQYGTGGTDDGNGVATDADGNVLLSGRVRHYPLGGAAKTDAFVRKFRGTNGATLWTRMLNSTGNEDDVASAVATDTLGNAYMAGKTEGDLDGPNQGRTDAFLAKFSKN